MIDLTELKRVVDIEYNNIVRDSDIYHDKLRVNIVDGSIVDIWFSKKFYGGFSYHWERRHIDGRIYRHDNFPDPRWREVSTFPKHFHNGSQNQVQESQINDNPVSGVREFMDFVRRVKGMTSFTLTCHLSREFKDIPYWGYNDDEELFRSYALKHAHVKESDR